MELLGVYNIIVPSLRLFKLLRGGRLLPLAFGLGQVHLLPPIFVIRKILRHNGGKLDKFLGLGFSDGTGFGLFTRLE